MDIEFTFIRKYYVHIPLSTVSNAQAHRGYGLKSMCLRLRIMLVDLVPGVTSRHYATKTRCLRFNVHTLCMYAYRMSVPGRECPPGPASPGPGGDWIPGLNSMNLGWIQAHNLLPRPGLPGTWNTPEILTF